MTLSVLEICTEALEEIGIDPPSGLVSGGDLGRQLLAIANTTGRMNAMRAAWEGLKTETTFTTVATSVQTDLAEDLPFIRRIIPHTMWNRTMRRPVIGPLSTQAWQRVQTQDLTPAIGMFHIRGNDMLFAGTPTADESIYFEYLDKRWASTADGNTLKERFTLDTDIPRIDDYSFVLGVRWRFLQKKGLEYGEVFRESEDWFTERIGSDVPRHTLSLNPKVAHSTYGNGEGNWMQNTNGLTWYEDTLSWG